MSAGDQEKVGEAGTEVTPVTPVTGWSEQDIYDWAVMALVRRYRPNEARQPIDVDPASFSCTETFRAADGYLSVGTLTFGEVAATIAAALAGGR